MLLMMMLLLLLGFLFFFIGFLFFFKKKKNHNKNNAFECGFNPFLITRVPFSLHFFKLCLIFIIFDIEIIIILPSPLSLTFYPMFLMYFTILMVIFLSSLFLEWQQNSLNWI